MSGFAKPAGVLCRGFPSRQEFCIGVCQAGRSFISGFAKSAGVLYRSLPNQQEFHVGVCQTSRSFIARNLKTTVLSHLLGAWVLNSPPSK